MWNTLNRTYVNIYPGVYVCWMDGRTDGWIDVCMHVHVLYMCDCVRIYICVYIYIYVENSVCISIYCICFQFSTLYCKYIYIYIYDFERKAIQHYWFQPRKLVKNDGAWQGIFSNKKGIFTNNSCSNNSDPSGCELQRLLTVAELWVL